MTLSFPNLPSFLNAAAPFLRQAKRLDAKNPEDIREAARIIKDGGIVAFPFNGIFGLFGDAHNLRAAEKIYRAKNRPTDRRLIIVQAPEYLGTHVDLDKLAISHKKLLKFWKEIHALGIILPASNSAPSHVVSERKDEHSSSSDKNILTIWTEYKPVRDLVEHFRRLGGEVLIGTSANKSGQPTHYQFSTLWKEFLRDVDAVIEDDFSHLDESRYKSTSVIDLTTGSPRLHRLGNVSEEEINKLLKKHNLPELSKDEVIVVEPRKKSK